MAQPVVSYPGSKWRFYPHMVEYFPTDMKVFVEPFFGGGSVSLSVADDSRFGKLERIVGGDLYTEMWALWQGIKQDPDAVIEEATKMFKQWCPHHEELRQSDFVAADARKYMAGGAFENYLTSDELSEADKKIIQSKLKLHDIACEEANKFWAWAQEVKTDDMALPERAARMLLVNKISFSGMGDAGSLSKDRFTEFYLDRLNVVYDAHRLLQKIEIYNVSFEKTMEIAEQTPNDSFVFLDPPYIAQEGSGLYGKNGSTHKGFPHEEFAKRTLALKSRWFVTYDDSVAVRKLFRGKTADGSPVCFKPFTIPGGYTMAGKTAEDALAGEELFISNMNLNEDSEDDYNF